MAYKYNPFTGDFDRVDDGTLLQDVETLTGNSGGPVGVDAAHNIDVLGDNTQGIDVVGTPASNLLTVTGIDSSTTQKGVQELTTDAEAIGGTDTTRAVTAEALKAKLGVQTENALAYGGGTTVAINWLGVATDGQLPIGSTGNPPVLNTLTEGTGITIINGPGTITISGTGQSVGTGQTVGAVTDDVITIDLGATPGTFTISASVSAFETSTPAGAGYRLTAMVRTTGAAGTLIGAVTQIIQEEAALAAGTATIVVVANTAIIRVTGTAALTVEWSATSDQVFAS